MQIRRLEQIIGIAIALIALVVYIDTLCPTVNLIDSGELATDVYTLGIAHPTGYPIFTLIGYVFSHLPLGMRIIYQLNLLAALLCASALYVFFQFLLFFIENFSGKDPSGTTRLNEIPTATSVTSRIIPAVVGTFILGFSETYWSQALSIEVYSLHVLFLVLLLFLFTKAMSRSVLPQSSRS